MKQCIRRIDCLRRSTVEHPFGAIKAWMGATHFKMKSLAHVAAEMALRVLAYNMKPEIAILRQDPPQNFGALHPVALYRRASGLGFRRVLRSAT